MITRLDRAVGAVIGSAAGGAPGGVSSVRADQGPGEPGLTGKAPP